MDKHQQPFVYLKPEQYYIDRYDLGTIRQCLHYYQGLYKELPKVMKLPDKDNTTEERRKTDWLRMMNMVIYSIKVQRFKDKAKTVSEWVESDRRKQDKLDDTEPGEFYCKSCNVLLNSIDKHLHDESDKDLRVLFLYECPRCKKREGYYDNGEMHKSKPTLCDKCGSEIDVSIKINDKKDTATWVYKCTGCDFKKTDVDDHKKWQKERDAQESKDKELLEKLRKDFCFTEEEGKEALAWFDSLKNITDDMKKREDKQKDPIYQKAVSLRKLKVVEVNKLLKEALEKDSFIELQLEKPEMGRFVAVPFVVQDGKADRAEYDSRTQLKKSINNTLTETNWRLMSDGVSYRVGYLSGKLRCHETEEDLMEISK